MSDALGIIGGEYADALRRSLSAPGEAALSEAYEIGRRALGEGLGVLDMAAIHARTVAELMRGPLDHPETAPALEAFDRFFIESLSPFEMAARGFREANTVLRRLNDVLEGQAKRIAYALHDEASQLLASIHLMLADLAAQQPKASRRVQAVRAQLTEIEARLRGLSHELRPPIIDDLGLVPALEFLADGMSKRWGLTIAVDASIARPVPATVETALYRIAQEALANVAKHAKATRAVVQVDASPERIRCSVIDDGVGIESDASRRRARRGLGLTEIQDRVAAFGGTFHLGRHADRGTDLTVEIPLEH